jgi:hypothetical protein
MGSENLGKSEIITTLLCMGKRESDRGVLEVVIATRLIFAVAILSANLIEAKSSLLPGRSELSAASSLGCDALNRPRQKTYCDSTPTVTYTYDSGCANGMGRLCAVISGGKTGTKTGTA